MNQYTGVNDNRERLEIFGEDFPSALFLYRNLNAGEDPVSMYIEKRDIRIASDAVGPTFTVTVAQPLLGSVYPASGPIAIGSELILTAVPAPGSTFVSWTIGTDIIATNPLRRIIAIDTAITANFI